MKILTSYDGDDEALLCMQEHFQAHCMKLLLQILMWGWGGVVVVGGVMCVCACVCV